MNTRHKKGFTLVELSIVLIIIGLIVSGVLVGQDLIRSAEITATVRQLQNYTMASSTFRAKYNALPGDLPADLATTFGFQTRAGTTGHGDGNGLLEGGAAASVNAIGETLLFWSDLGISTLISGSYNQANLDTTSSITSGTVSNYMPAAKIGKGNYVYVFSAGGINYYGISGVTSTDAAGVYTNASALKPGEAYQIDTKMDDGYPDTGIVTAVGGTAPLGAATTNATAGSAGCIYTGVTPNTYNAQDQTSSCQLQIRMF